ncbi:iron(III) transport system ATP-binding protein [Halospina denitrificans]|uniref:Iron(III) transport system ATP-binding protein n=2 Tax=Halospina denitrificans TaxID=332522 RepID=A0A4R7JTN5_9GAMM|nr:iron(III) transport system ATP-binding protein [Halospina denitrificans]
MLEETSIYPMNQDTDDTQQRPPMGPLLSISSLSKQYPRTQARAVNDVSFNLYSGEILALLGPSGCGKTTTLRMLAGFETPDTGSIHLKDRDITSLPPQKRHIGMVFQDYALFPHMTLAENVTFAMQQIARDQRYTKALEWLELVGLGDLADRFPEELSGGQQQRVALVRTLAAEPELVLLDEPFSNLDAGLRERTRKEMRRLFKKTGTSVVLVTHDQAEAMTMADRIGVMKDGDLLQLGPPQQVYREPANAFVAEFLGHTNLLEAQASGESAATPLGQVDLNAPAEGRVTLSLRPEHLALVPSDDSDSATVVDREFRGHDYFYVLQRGEQRYCAIVPNHEPLEVGDRVRLKAHRQASVLPAEQQRKH